MKKAINLRLEEGLYRIIKELAKRERRSINAEINHLLDLACKQEELRENAREEEN